MFTHSQKKRNAWETLFENHNGADSDTGLTVHTTLFSLFIYTKNCIQIITPNHSSISSSQTSLTMSTTNEDLQGSNYYSLPLSFTFSGFVFATQL